MKREGKSKKDFSPKNPTKSSFRTKQNAGEHDFEFKLKHAKSFLQDGAKVKAFVFFRGRTIVFKEQGQILLLKLAQALEDVGIVEDMPKLDGKKMIMIIAPKKKK